MRRNKDTRARNAGSVALGTASSRQLGGGTRPPLPGPQEPSRQAQRFTSIDYEGGATGASLAGVARRKVSKRETAQRDAVELEGFAGRVKIGQ
ncbi:MAG: hypothetical protein ACREC0_01630 [Methylocella sp.]